MPIIFNPLPDLSERDIERFWAKVALTANPDKCWEWTGRLVEDGYGHFDWSRGRKNKRSLSAHRVAYTITKGEITEGKILMHSCNNPKCINPAHLSEGNHEENARYMQLCGRGVQYKGEQHNSAKLTEEKVREIRKARAAGVGTTELSLKYRVGVSTIKRIVARKIWKMVE